MIIKAEDDINNLNKYLEGIYMAIDTFEHYTTMTKDPDTLSLLNDIKREFKSSACEIMNRIMDLGGKSREEVSLLGKTTGALKEIKDKLTVKSDNELLTEGYKSIETGLKMGYKFLEDNALTSKSREIIERDLKKQNTLLDIFPSMIPLKK